MTHPARIPGADTSVSSVQALWVEANARPRIMPAGAKAPLLAD